MSIAASERHTTRSSAATAESNSRHQRLTRVLHVINGDDFSGAERVQDLLALRLPDFGYAVSFVCLKPGRFDSTRSAQEVPLYDIPMRSKFDLRPACALARLVGKGGYEIVHSHFPRTLLVSRPAAAWMKVPLVHHVQCPALAGSTHSMRNRVNAVVERICLTGVTKVIAVSRSLGTYLRSQGVPNQRIAVIPNSVPVVGPLPARSRPTETWTIGICAMFRPRKGIEVLLESLAELKNANVNLRLRAVGYFQEPAYESQIKQRVKELGIEEVVQWCGFSHNVFDELAKMDLFVLPSLFGEGLPLAILEAMAAGVPVVSTNVEGTPEAVRDGLDGVIVEPGSATALTAGFKRIMDGQLDWQSLRESAHRRQSEEYSDTKLAADVANVYDNLLARKTSAATRSATSSMR